MSMTLPSKRHTVRLPHYDYRRAGGYFVTICSHQRACIFGDIHEGNVSLSPIGRIVESAWQNLPEHHLQVMLDEFIIMPNHVHGILLFSDSEEDTAGCVPTRKFGSIAPASLSVVVRSFKSAVTRQAHATLRHADTIWQPRFYEHVIRNDEDLYNIRKYIQENPLKWELDKENPANL
ncbi:MAG: transposase [bacterium]|nr:transposase [bacterium]